MKAPFPWLTPDLLHRLDDGFVFLDARGHYQFVNEAAERLLDLPNDALLGRHIWDVFPQAHDTPFRGPVDRALRHGEAAHVEGLNARRGLWYDVQVYPADGGVAIIFRDISEKRRTELALQQSEERLRLAVDVAELGAWSYQPATGVFACDARCRTLLALPPEGPVDYDGFLKQIHPDDREAASHAVAQLVEAHREGRFHVEYRVRAAGGAPPSWLASQAKAYVETDGALRLVGTLLDVSPRKRLEEAYARALTVEREQVQQLQSLAAAAAALGAADTLEDRLQILTDRARDVIGAHQSVTSLTVNQNWAQAITAVSLSDKYAAWADYDVPPSGQGIYTVVCRNNTPMRMSQEALEQHMAWRGFGDHAGEHPPMRGWLAVPLVGRDGQNLGLIQLSDRYEGDFTEQDEAVLMQLAHIAAEEIENARTEAALRESEAQRRLALEAAAAGTWSYDLEKGLLHVDARSLAIFGLNVEAPLTFIEFLGALHAEDRPQVERAVAAALHPRTGGRYESEARVVRPNGTVRWVTARGQAYFEGKGNERRAVRFLGTVMDVTERRDAEEAVRTSESRLRALIDAAAQIFWITTGEGVPIASMEGWQRFTGQDEQQWQGEGWANALHPEDVERTLAAWRRAVQGKTIFNVEYRLQHHAGGYRWTSVRGVPILRADGSVREWVGMNIDIDARKRAEEKLRNLASVLEGRVQERTRELEQRNRELQEFAYVASHDLQEPLRKFHTFLQMLRQEIDPVDEFVADMLGRMDSAATRMSELMQGLLAFSRVATRGETFREVDLNEVVAAVLNDLEVSVDEARAEVAVGPLCTVVGDPTQMRQLFQNLLGNALKFQRPEVPTRILLAAAPGDNGRCRITVADNGIGIQPQFLDRIFAPFQRLHGRTAYPGSGMGLAICRRIVERHGGKLTVESTPGEGTTFTVTLPVEQPPGA